MPLLKKKTAERLGVMVVMAIAVLTRLWNLGYPNRLVFDETYYVKDALTLSVEGHEKTWPDGANQAFESGEVLGYLDQAAFVVHPPLGKWLISSGMWLTGPEQSFGWRLSTALLGIATVALLMLVAHKLFNSMAMSITAGLFLAIDGLAITLSRTALLDGSLTFFLLLGFWFFLLDQQRSRLLIVDEILKSKSSILWFRPYLILTGVVLGAASSIKWSGLYLLAGIGIYLVISETALRRNSGEKSWLTNGLLFQGTYSFLNLVPSALLIYLLSWLGWIFGSDGYERNWAKDNPTGFGPDWLVSLWHYHQMIYNFHVGLTTPHSYAAHPLGWLVGLRPTAFFYESYEFGQNGCQIESGCSTAITALGNPLLWLSSTLAIGYLLYRYARSRERILGLILLGVSSLYLPWLVFSGRTVFQFYVVSFQPWLILGLVFAIWQLRSVIAAKNQSLSKVFLPAFTVLAIAVSAFFLPINTGIFIPFELWQQRMWLPSWI